MKDEVLFTPQFQSLYTLLGVVSFMSAREHGGISSGNLFHAFPRNEIPMMEKSLQMLTAHGIVVIDEGGLLHLENKFYDLTMWDLLLMCMPCMETADPLCTREGGNFFRSFMSSEKIWKTLISNI